MKILSLAVITLFSLVSSGQSIKERLIYTFSNDSMLSRDFSFTFDQDGNYLLEYKKAHDEWFCITKSDTLGPFRYPSGASANGGHISQFYNSLVNDDNKKFYYRNSSGIKYYGPMEGQIEYFITNYSSKDVAMTIKRKDSVYFYLNNELKAKRLIDKNKYKEDEKWCSFSKRGNHIYFIKKSDLYELYINDKLLDTSKHMFYDLCINDSNYYTYVKRGHKTRSGLYTVFVHTPDTVIGPAGSWDYQLNEDGSYYNSYNDKEDYNITINNKKFTGIKKVSNITFADRNNFLFTFLDSSGEKVNVNGQVFPYNFTSIYYPNLDTRGNFSFFGLKDYYLFIYTNGITNDKPLSKYKVRATPVFISPSGSAVYYFRTDDSTYLYKDDTLLLPGFSNLKKFSRWPYHEIIARLNAPNPKVARANRLSYIEIDSVGYWLYNGNLSRPMINPKEQSIGSESKIGQFVTGDLNEFGFFSIQKTGDTTYEININNTVYKKTEGIDEINKYDYFFNGKELIFYGQKGLSFYQYTLTL